MLDDEYKLIGTVKKGGICTRCGQIWKPNFEFFSCFWKCYTNDTCNCNFRYLYNCEYKVICSKYEFDLVAELSPKAKKYSNPLIKNGVVTEDMVVPLCTIPRVIRFSPVLDRLYKRINNFDFFELKE